MVHAAAILCGAKTNIVLPGYSLGAWVTHDGAEFVIDSDRQYIAALVLIADPGYSGTDHGIGIGTALKTINGLIGPTSPPTYLANKTVSVCDQHDAVCQSDLGDLAFSGDLVHTVD
jgi:Cutinase